MRHIPPAVASPCRRSGYRGSAPILFPDEVYSFQFFFNMFRYRGDTRQKPDTVPVGFSAAGFFLCSPHLIFGVTGSRKKILYFRLLFHKENRQTDFLYIRLSNGRSAALCRKRTWIASYPNLVPASYFLRRSIQKYAGNNAENSNDVLIQYRIVNMRTDCNHFRSATFFCIKYMVIVKLYEKRFKNISSDFYI